MGERVSSIKIINLLYFLYNFDNMESNQDLKPEIYIKKIIESRILGTGVHLTSLNNKKLCISYQKIPIYGIKKALVGFINDIYDQLMEDLPKNENELNSSIIEESLKKLALVYSVDPNILLDKFKEVKIPSENWNSMDVSLKIAIIINSFFDSIDETMKNYAEKYEENNELFELLERNRKDAPPINYDLEDFGFVFRARIYCWLYSWYRCNNSYLNLIKRIDKQLYRLYREYFVEKKRISYSEREISKKNQVDPVLKSQNLIDSDEIRAIASDLDSKDEKKILNAIRKIHYNKILELKPQLEYLFNHSNIKIAESALETYLSFQDSEN